MLHRRFRNYSKLIARFIRFDSSSKPPVQGYSESNQKLAGGKLREGYCSAYLVVESRIACTGTFQLKCKFSARRDSANDCFSVSSIKSLTSLIDLLEILKGVLLYSTVEPLFNWIWYARKGNEIKFVELCKYRFALSISPKIATHFTRDIVNLYWSAYLSDLAYNTCYDNGYF